MIAALDNPVQRYAWGSRDAIPRLLGVKPDGEPQAELWLGAHERAASQVRTESGPESLLEVVRRSPETELGPAWAGEGRLPFLAKVIATARPLSLQVHPEGDLAARGFAAEERRGIPRDGQHRSFPDPVAKAEMVWALSSFRALCGFRPPEEAADWLETLDVAELEPTAAALRERGAGAVRGEVGRLLRLRGTAEAVAAVRARAYVLEQDVRWAESARVARELASRYPLDPAVCLALLLRPVSLAPGEAMFVRPGQPHSYLSGTAFEVQANSDNVLRAGLTGKHVDVDLVAEAVDPGDGVSAVRGEPLGEEEVFAPETSRFALSVVRRAHGAPGVPDVPGPQVFLCLDGDFCLGGPGDPLRLGPGASAYASAASGPLQVRGSGTLLRVTTGRAESRRAVRRSAAPERERDSPRREPTA